MVICDLSVGMGGVQYHEQQVLQQREHAGEYLVIICKLYAENRLHGELKVNSLEHLLP